MKKLMALSLIICCAAYAETNNEIRLKETVITGTGFDDTQNSQIKNISVIKKEDIENKGYNTVEDILRNAPGVNFVHNGFGMVADIRGQGREEATKRVKILVDGIQVNILDLSHGLAPINTIPVDAIEKIEIINGGGSVLYGSGTAGGVINIITKKTQKDRVSGKVYFQNGSFDTNKVGFTTGVKVTDNFLVDLGYEYQDGDAYRDKEKSESNDFRGGFTYNITENQTLRFKASKYKQDYVETGFLTLEEAERNRKQASSTLTDGKLDRTEYSVDYTIKATDNLKFDLIGYKQKTKREYDQISASGTTVDGLFQDEKKGINLKGNYDYGSGKFIFGYDYMNADAIREAINTFKIVTPRGTMTAGSETYINLGKDSHSIYALNRHSLTDKLESTLGYRYEKSDYDIDRKAYSVMRGIKTNAGNIESNKSTTNHAYEAGLNYKYSTSGNVYVKYERGFRSPSPTELVDKDAATQNYTLNNVKSETYDTFEIGMKDVIANSYVSATAFFTRTDDEIYTVFASGGHGTGWTVRNLQETERTGVEFFAEQYFDKFRINESLTYVNAKVSKGNKKGDKIPYVSKVKATLGATYDLTTEFAIKADLNYYSAPRDSRNNKLHSRVTADLSTVYKHESGLGVQAGVKNIFGKKYYLYENKAGNSYSPAAERTYYVGISYNF